MLLKRQLIIHKIISLALVLITAFCLLLFTAALSLAQSVPAGKCNDSFPNLVSDICWKCMFPVRIGGTTIMNIGDMPDNVGTANADDFNPSGQYLCTCPDNDGDGIPEVGIYVSYWEPARVFEVVQKPNCFPFLFGLDMGNSLNLFGAYGEKGGGPGESEKAFYNVHYYMFPLFEIMDILVGTDFCTDFLSDIDLGYFTEVDPFWNDDELTVYLNPEAIIFGNPIAQALCSVDCLTSSAGFPLNTLFWCAGCWGSMYPYTGNTGAVGSPVRVSSLLTARALARFARLPVPPAIEFDTSSASAKCGGQIRPLLKKSQYKFSTLFPIPETSGKCCHVLGSSTFLWGEHRNIPAKGEYQIYLMWRKRNCCLKLL